VLYCEIMRVFWQITISIDLEVWIVLASLGQGTERGNANHLLSNQLAVG